MMQKGGTPYSGGKQITPRVRRLSWVQNLDDIAMEDRENYIQELYNRGRNEVGTILMKQERRMSELTEEWENRAEQQQIMDQNAYRNFLKKKLDELCQYLGAKFTIALEEKNDLQDQRRWTLAFVLGKNLKLRLARSKDKCKRSITSCGKNR